MQFIYCFLSSVYYLFQLLSGRPAAHFHQLGFDCSFAPLTKHYLERSVFPLSDVMRFRLGFSPLLVALTQRSFIKKVELWVSPALRVSMLPFKFILLQRLPRKTTSCKGKNFSIIIIFCNSIRVLHNFNKQFNGNMARDCRLLLSYLARHQSESVL